MQERRRFVRIPESLSISYEVMNEPKTEAFVTKDIGQGGIRFLVSKFIPENTLLKVRPTFSKIHFSFEAVVRVVWIKEQPLRERFEIGVEFIDISKKAKEHLINYIKSITE